MDCGRNCSFEYLDQNFRFELCRKRDQSLGNVKIDHWWMPVTPLYGQREKRRSVQHNHQEILRFAWSEIMAQQAQTEREAQERFLLASLVPYVRAEGSRTIFADAFLRTQTLAQQAKEVCQLDDSLTKTRTQRVSRSEFEARTKQMLGQIKFPPTTQSTYDELSASLFEQPCQLLSAGDREAALEKVLESWKKLMQSIGRRAGQENRKIVLNALSYEARAAFHDFYSVTWLGILYALERTENLDEISLRFLRFWHLVDATAKRTTSLFQGHVFALHPSTGLFVLSSQGATLLGDWIAEPESLETYERILHGLMIAVGHYASRRLEATVDRPRPQEYSVEDIQVVEEFQQEIKRGRRRPRKKLSE